MSVAAGVPVAGCEGSEIVSPSRVVMCVVVCMLGLMIELSTGVSSGTVAVAATGHSTHCGVAWTNSLWPP